MKKVHIFLILYYVSMVSCQHNDHEHEPGNEIPLVSVTKWTEQMEIFMEYEYPLTGQEVKFIIHLTTLKNFQPVRNGKVILTFEDTSGERKTLEWSRLLREGIFTPTARFEKNAEYDFKIRYEGDELTETFHIGKFSVLKSIEDIVTDNEPETDDISFLKEQQWKVEFATDPAKMRSIQSSVQAAGEVAARPESYAEIVSPVEGIISISEAGQLAKPGEKVSKGQTMAILRPPLVIQNSWVEIYLNYDQAKKEYERASRLMDRNAISSREYEDAEREYKRYQASFSAYFESSESGISFDTNTQQFLILAPINGIVAEAAILPGQKIDRGYKIFSIVNPEYVWLKFEIFANQASALHEISGAILKIPGHEENVLIDRKDIKVISRGEIVDREKQTFTLLLEVNNRSRQLMIGQTLYAHLYSGSGKFYMSVPVSAVFEENMQKIVFVQKTGESFEKRMVKTGAEYYNYVAILDGLEEGERVVTQGGYLVKLATTTEAIGHGHTH